MKTRTILVGMGCIGFVIGASWGGWRSYQATFEKRMDDILYVEIWKQYSDYGREIGGYPNWQDYYQAKRLWYRYNHATGKNIPWEESGFNKWNEAWVQQWKKPRDLQ